MEGKAETPLCFCVWNILALDVKRLVIRLERRLIIRKSLCITSS